VGAPLSGSLPSTWNSRWPRGRWTALGRAPCSYSSGSRTSRKVTPPPSSNACASACSTSRMDAFASLRRSRGVAKLYLRVAPSRPYGLLRRVKHYQRGQHSPGPTRALGPDHGPLRTRWETPSMELGEAVRRRAMVRSFSAEPVERGAVAAILEAALRAPTAGNTGGTAWVALVGPEETEAYWSATTDEAWRSSNPARAAGLHRAPALVLAYAPPAAYVARYGEADKAGSGLGAGADAWPVPYWHGDAAFGVMTVLLAAVDHGLGACVLGNFRGGEVLAAALGVLPS